MAHIILVHGMAANKLSWNRLPDDLRAAGHTVENVTLPGHGDPSASKANDMSDYVAGVAKAFPTKGQAVLIGHSMGGFVISQTAANFRENVSQLIYVAAMYPEPGDSIIKLSAEAGSNFEDVFREFAEAGAPKDALVQQPPGPLHDPFGNTQDISTLPRHYIQCSDDQILPLPLQTKMISHWPGTTVTQLDTGHLPQYTTPDPLRDMVLAALV